MFNPQKINFPFYSSSRGFNGCPPGTSFANLFHQIVFECKYLIRTRQGCLRRVSDELARVGVASKKCQKYLQHRQSERIAFIAIAIVIPHNLSNDISRKDYGSWKRYFLSLSLSPSRFFLLPEGRCERVLLARRTRTVPGRVQQHRRRLLVLLRSAERHAARQGRTQLRELGSLLHQQRRMLTHLPRHNR
jgi:hypothetical protein